ncbi:MAG: acetate/propionate family kinase [Saprospiraceae bacterium]
MILTLNAGSSSLKFSVFNLAAGEEEVANGLVERIGSAAGQATFEIGGEKQRLDFQGDHGDALSQIGGFLRKQSRRTAGQGSMLDEIKAVGHRVVHGGEALQQPTIITSEVEQTIERLIPLAPLHNPVNLQGIQLAKEALANVPHVAVFDTAFHSTMPDHAYRYPVPNEWYTKHGVRKYGFHGTSHAYVSAVARSRYARILVPRTGQVLSSAPAAGAEEEKKHDKIITLHLGNGCSAAAIVGGKCVDTTMGLTPLEGLMMGTRAGDVDPGLASYMHGLGMSVADYDKALNKASGLLGIAAENDMRTLLSMREEGSASARLAIAMFVYRLRKTVGAFAAAMGGIDALIFTAGIGENAAVIRAEVCEGLGFLGIEISTELNAIRNNEPRFIGHGKCPVLVVPTNEELQIARATAAVIGAAV